MLNLDNNSDNSNIIMTPCCLAAAEQRAGFEREQNKKVLSSEKVLPPTRFWRADDDRALLPLTHPVDLSC